MKKGFWVVEMTCGLVHASYRLPEWQAVKLSFFAPCSYHSPCTLYSVCGILYKFVSSFPH